ncbi:Scr1 family TA system antitoxin-like transcriptional regulator [Streptomyces sp. NPDC046557]|uniref:Scr1 family TA system antitoxin-like transcriptional regulator n=1 Tax=Streptomyces sp. NPDC046557 TaxID=3155372 RepID=UPI0033F1F894
MLWQVVDSREVMRDQLEHLTHMSTQPPITMQVLPHSAGAHPGVPGQFSILEFANTSEPGVVYHERFTETCTRRNVPTSVGSAY